MTKPARTMKPANVSALLGLESTVDAYVSACAKEEQAKQAKAAARAVLDPVATDERRALERQGIATKHVSIKGTGQDARYTFPDRYKALAPTLATDLTALVGPDTFGALFAESETVQLAPGVELADLLRLFPELGAHLVTVREICPVEGFSVKRAALRRALTDEQNAGLDAVTDAISPAPSLSVK